ncbi:MAG: hypothetical protein CM1200mP18_07710 [Gammaproteobacteria bacterium]|nr:MAG: hypothetical protein CM1200mP18_07710 [Gammaproteobacteria bacterium]
MPCYTTVHVITTDNMITRAESLNAASTADIPLAKMIATSRFLSPQGLLPVPAE